MAAKKHIIDAELIKKFIVDGLNNKDPKKAFGHDAIEILTEIEYAEPLDVVEVVRCKNCTLHGNCTTEDTFNFARVEDPFCCVGKTKN